MFNSLEDSKLSRLFDPSNWIIFHLKLNLKIQNRYGKLIFIQKNLNFGKKTHAGCGDDLKDLEVHVAHSFAYNMYKCTIYSSSAVFSKEPLIIIIIIN